MTTLASSSDHERRKAASDAPCASRARRFGGAGRLPCPRGWVCALALAAVGALGGPRLASADAARDLVISADALRSVDPLVRAEAAERLSTLGRSALPAIDARLDALEKRAVDPEEGYQALRRFAHAAGSRRADESIDIEPGIKAKLKAERPSSIEAAVAEELLLLRSLEKIGSAAAYRRAVRIFGMHYDVFRWESRHSSARVGTRALPALLDAAAYGDAGLAEWARLSLEALGRPSPADALRGLEGEDRAELLRTYAERRIMDAMESVAAFLDDPDPVVRNAAIASLRRYGRNAIWQIRDMARILLGEDLDHAWGAQKSLDHLVERLEARRLAPQREATARAEELLARGELDEARAALEPVLAERPKMPEARKAGARLYAALAERAARRGDHDDAARLYVEASLVTPDAERRRELRESARESRAARAIAREQFHPSLLERGTERAAAATAATGAEPAAAERSVLPALTLVLGLVLLLGTAPIRWTVERSRSTWARARSRAAPWLRALWSRLEAAAASGARRIAHRARALVRARLARPAPRHASRRPLAPAARLGSDGRAALERAPRVESDRVTRDRPPPVASAKKPAEAKLPVEFVFGAGAPRSKRAGALRRSEP